MSHSGVRRNSGELYINHVADVAMNVVSFFNTKDVNTICAALLHDTVEDNPEIIVDLANKKYSENIFSIDDPIEALSYLTNKNIASVVKALTNPVPEEGESKLQAYIKHIAVLLNSDSLDERAAEIKFSDFFDNAVVEDGASDKKRNKLDEKYVSVFCMFLVWIETNNKLSDRKKKTLVTVLRNAYEQTCKRIENNYKTAVNEIGRLATNPLITA